MQTLFTLLPVFYLASHSARITHQRHIHRGAFTHKISLKHFITTWYS